MLQAVLVQRVAGHVVSLGEGGKLLAPACISHSLFLESHHAERKLLVSAVSHHTVSLQSGCRGQRFGEPHGVHLVVKEHAQANLHIVYLHVIDLRLCLHALQHELRETVGSRKARHGNHLVAHLVKRLKTRLVV